MFVDRLLVDVRYIVYTLSKATEGTVLPLTKMGKVGEMGGGETEGKLRTTSTLSPTPV